MSAHAADLARPNAWWGMLLFIATEATLFLVLCAAYFYLRFKSAPAWPPGGIAEPKLTIPLVMTALIVSSGVPAYMAEAGIRAGNRARLEWGLLTAALLGALFLLVQAHEFVVRAEQFAPETNAYGSLFFTITGLHAAHVASGVLVVLWALVRTWQGAFSPQRHTGVQAAALYWQFMWLSWLLVLATLYLSPRW